MSRGINKVILIGNLGTDPDVRYLPNGNAVTNLSVATGETWKDRQTGEPQERTEWHRVVIFGKLADIAGQYLHKGSKVYLEGKLQTRKWQDQGGIDRYTTEVVVDSNGQLHRLDGREHPAAPAKASENADTEPLTASTGGGHQSLAQAVVAGADDFDDDIPFASGEGVW